MEEAEVWNWPSEAEEKAAAAPFNLKDVKCETVGGTEIQGGHPCITRLPGGARFQFERWRDLEEVEDLGVLWIELCALKIQMF